MPAASHLSHASLKRHLGVALRSEHILSVVALAALLVIGFLLRLQILRAPIDYYETHTMARTFQDTTLTAVLARHDFSFLKLAFYYWSMDAMTEIFGRDLTVVRYVSIVFSLVSIAYAFFLGRELSNRRAGLIFAAFIATLPTFVHYGANGRSYSIQVALVLMSWLYFVRSLSANTRIKEVVSVFAYFSINALGVYTHLTFFGIIALQLLVVAGMKLAATTSRTGLVLKVNGLVAVAYAPMVPYTKQALKVVRDHGDGVPGAESVASLALFPGLPMMSLLLTIVIVLVSIGVAIVLWSRPAALRHQARVIAALVGVLTVPVAGSFALDTIFYRTLTLRYLLIFVMPIPMLMALLMSMGSRLNNQVTALMVVLVTAGTAYISIGSGKPSHEPFEQMAAMVVKQGKTFPIVSDRLPILQYALVKGGFAGRFYNLKKNSRLPLPPHDTPIWVFHWLRFVNRTVDFRSHPHMRAGPFVVYLHPSSDEFFADWGMQPLFDRDSARAHASDEVTDVVGG